MVAGQGLRTRRGAADSSGRPAEAAHDPFTGEEEPHQSPAGGGVDLHTLTVPRYFLPFSPFPLVECTALNRN